MDIDWVAAVDAPPHAEWSAVATWLRAAKAVTTRRARLADVAAFVRGRPPSAAPPSTCCRACWCGSGSGIRG
ncbi:hypothetical protein [Streptosporangium sandarakinum]